MPGVLSEAKPSRYWFPDPVQGRTHDRLGLQDSAGRRHEVPYGVRGGEAVPPARHDRGHEGVRGPRPAGPVAERDHIHQTLS